MTTRLFEMLACAAIGLAGCLYVVHVFTSAVHGFIAAMPH